MKDKRCYEEGAEHVRLRILYGTKDENKKGENEQGLTENGMTYTVYT